MRKRITRGISLVLAAVLCLSLMPATAMAAVSSDRAKVYLEKLKTRPDASSYLVDFDGDGADELLLLWGQENAQQYAIWSGSTLLTQRELKRGYDLRIVAVEGQTYLAEHWILMADEDVRLFTLRNGTWASQRFEFITTQSEGPDDPNTQGAYRLDGRDVVTGLFDLAYAAFEDAIRPYGIWDVAPLQEKGIHSVREQLTQAAYSDSAYKDVLSSLSTKEKTALYQRLLCNVTVALSGSTDWDFRTVSDVKLLECLIRMPIMADFPFEEYGRSDDGYIVFSSDAFSKLTTELFGRSIDEKEVLNTSPPVKGGSQIVLYQGHFYLPTTNGHNMSSNRADAQSLYSLGENKYYAAFTHVEWHYSIPEYVSGTYGAVVKKNPDQTWTLIHLYPANYTPSTAELAAYVNPSAWAQKEVTAAKNVGLVPALTGEPGYQDASTREQFAELVVTLTEKLTGKEITPASDSTFTDCKETAVLKAYAAGIVSGVGNDQFAPDTTTNREQIAAMIYRAIDYVAKETNVNLAPAAADISKFSDKGAVSGWAVDGVGTLAANGIMSGTSATTLSPKSACTVEQSILLLYRAFEKYQAIR